MMTGATQGFPSARPSPARPHDLSDGQNLFQGSEAIVELSSITNQLFNLFLAVRREGPRSICTPMSVGSNLSIIGSRFSFPKT